MHSSFEECIIELNNEIKFAIIVNSLIHYKQERSTGFDCNIHTVLPLIFY